MNRMNTIETGEFDADWASLCQFKCPDWFRDAKLGIWSHWGPQSVPMQGDWYARLMYIEGTNQYYHHWRHYGHPCEHGWKDMVQLWKAEKFDPKALMELYVDAGAKYFCAQAMHHDNFDNFDSSYNPWNSTKMGPGKDIVGLWKEACEAYELPFGLSEHLGATYNWGCQNKNSDQCGPYKGVPYDGNMPKYRDFYLDNKEELQYDTEVYLQPYRWYTQEKSWQEHWFDRMKDMIDKYMPDLLYTDGGLPFGQMGLGIVAHLYNTSCKTNGKNQAVYNQKDKSPLVHKVGVLDVERGVIDGVQVDPWQTDTCVGSWFYDTNARYKSARHVIEMLIDIVSKNGNLLLNIPQRPDGTIDEECRLILKEMSGWMTVNSEGIHGTRPWYIGMEGQGRFPKHHFSKEAGWDESEVEWTPEDYRFTCKEKCIYAFRMAWNTSGTAKIKAMVGSSHVGSLGMAVVDIEEVRLLGYDGELKFEIVDDGLQLSGLPVETQIKYGHCFKIICK